MEHSLVKSFTNSNLNTSLTVIKIGDEVWFIAKEVAEVLEYSSTPKALRVIKEKYKKMFNFEECKEIFSGAHFGHPEINSNGMYLINKSGLIQLVLNSTKPEAEKFQDWILEEVIPQVLEKGSYGITQKQLPNDYLTALKALVAAEEEKQKLALEAKFEKEQKELALNQRDEAIRAKSYISDKKTATALGRVGGLVKENNCLKDNLYGNRNYRTIRAVASMNHLSDKDLNWRRLKAYCITNNLEIKKVPDEKFGTISSYPVEAFKAVYPELTIR